MTHEEVTAAVTAIEATDHPPYGEDWTGWLDEHTERMARAMWERDFCEAHSDPDGEVRVIWAL